MTYFYRAGWHAPSPRSPPPRSATEKRDVSRQEHNKLLHGPIKKYPAGRRSQSRFFRNTQSLHYWYISITSNVNILQTVANQINSNANLNLCRVSWNKNDATYRSIYLSFNFNFKQLENVNNANFVYFGKSPATSKELGQRTKKWRKSKNSSRHWSTHTSITRMRESYICW